MTNFYGDFDTAINVASARLKNGSKVHTERWQSVDISQQREAEMVEVLFHSLAVRTDGYCITDLQRDIQPHLPWAEAHFQERVGGSFNPGITWRSWPYALSADRHRTTEGERFSHTYGERYWPPPLQGIRYTYGDLAGLVRLLRREPDTRQAYLPVWFPEDTGDTHRERKPCTLGYWFILRDNRLSMMYSIRSCDFRRHFRDDIYLSVRLMQWVLSNCEWKGVTTGDFIMHIGSLHCFIGDLSSLP